MSSYLTRAQHNLHLRKATSSMSNAMKLDHHSRDQENDSHNCNTSQWLAASSLPSITTEQYHAGWETDDNNEISISFIASGTSAPHCDKTKQPPSLVHLFMQQLFMRTLAIHHTLKNLMANSVKWRLWPRHCMLDNRSTERIKRRSEHCPSRVLPKRYYQMAIGISLSSLD